MRKIESGRIDELFSAILKNSTLYIPQDTEGGAKFVSYKPGDKLSGKLNTVRSAKDFFFPQTENLMDFKTDGKNIEVIDTRKECEDFVLFGVRACDVKSFEVLDRVFLGDPVDTYYKNRRDHAVIISLACKRPAETCFCKTFSIDASSPKGDIEAHECDGYFYFSAVTEKGEQLLKSVADITQEADGSKVNELKELIKERINNLPLSSLSAEKFGSGMTEKYFDDPKWKNLSESCLGCGTCTFVCPTCQCYDIKDFNTGNGIKRFRCWDSCMYSDFTKMSAGQPRLTQLERFRQRFMHKLVYYPTNNDGLFSCVGCGRCLSKCPIGMNIVKVMKALGGNEND